jgi:hypothetical protein
MEEIYTVNRSRHYIRSGVAVRNYGTGQVY